MKKVKPSVDLTDYNKRAYEQKLRGQSLNAQLDNPDLVQLRQDELYGRNRELERLEEKLGIDGIKPSESKKFVPRALTGTTSFSAFSGPSLRAVNNGEYEEIK